MHEVLSLIDLFCYCRSSCKKFRVFLLREFFCVVICYQNVTVMFYSMPEVIT